MQITWSNANTMRTIKTMQTMQIICTALETSSVSHVIFLMDKMNKFIGAVSSSLANTLLHRLTGQTRSLSCNVCTVYGCLNYCDIFNIWQSIGWFQVFEIEPALDTFWPVRKLQKLNRNGANQFDVWFATGLNWFAQSLPLLE